MEINKTKKVDPTNLVLSKCKKKQIILAHTGSNLDDYFSKLFNRYNKKYDKAAAYVIALDGTVYELFDPSYYTHFMEDDSIDKMAITVLLENVGWLYKDARDNTFYDWKNHPYYGEIKEVDWRNKKFWADYTSEQMKSIFEILPMLCTKYKIPYNFIGDNITTHKPKSFNGIINRSNYNKNNYDLSPAFDFNKLNNYINKLNDEGLPSKPGKLTNKKNRNDTD